MPIGHERTIQYERKSTRFQQSQCPRDAGRLIYGLIGGRLGRFIESTQQPPTPRRRGTLFPTHTGKTQPPPFRQESLPTSRIDGFLTTDGILSNERMAKIAARTKHAKRGRVVNVWPNRAGRYSARPLDAYDVRIRAIPCRHSSPFLHVNARPPAGGGPRC